MKKKLLVHVGLPKTGTTAVQKFFADNKHNLTGITYLESARGLLSHHHLIPAMMGASVPDGLLSAAPNLTDLDHLARLINSEIHSSNSSISLISSEFLMRIGQTALDEFFDKIEFDTEYLMTFANPAHHSVSIWSETVRGGFTEFGLSEYLHSDQLELQSQLISKWLSSDQKRLLNYVFINSRNAIQCILKSIGPDSSVVHSDLTNTVENVSLVPAATEALRKLHNELPDIGATLWGLNYWPSLLSDLSRSLSRRITTDSRSRIFEILDSECTFLSKQVGQVLNQHSLKREFLQDYSFVTKSKFDELCTQILAAFSYNEIRKNKLAHDEIYRLNQVANGAHRVSGLDSDSTDKIDDFFVLGEKHSPYVIAGHSHRRSVEVALGKTDRNFASLFRVVTGGLPTDSGKYWDLVSGEDGRICLFWNGNEANVLSILPDEEFQIWLDDSEDVDPTGVSVVTRANLESYFCDCLKPLVLFLTGISNSSRVVLCSPPPPKSRDYLLTVLKSEEYFNRRLKAQTDLGKDLIILNDRERVLLHQIYLGELKKVSEQFGATFLETPRGAIADDGTLREEFSLNDCTHANEKYGVLVLEQLSRIGDQP